MLNGFRFAHSDQYSRVFAIEAATFNGLLENVIGRIDLPAHVAAMKAKQDAGDDVIAEPDMTMTDDGIACLSIIGVLTKYGSSLSSAASTIALRQSIRKMAADPKCVGMMIRCDSPGGTADGTEELASEVAAFAAKKPVFGFADGMACSAMYWVYSQCDYCMCGPAGIIGSIGTYSMLYDRSGQFEQAGVKAVVIRAGKYKGTGAPGTEIDDGQIADQQRLVDQLNDVFVNGVAKGRKLSADRASKIADGRVHVGENAKSMGLVDQIGSYDHCMAKLVSRAKASRGVK